jgi:hypothetical protein
VQVFSCFHDIFPEAFGIGETRSFVEDSALYAAPKMLDEVSVQLGVNLTNRAIGIDFDASGLGAGLFAAKEGVRARKESRELPAGQGGSKVAHMNLTA